MQVDVVEMGRRENEAIQVLIAMFHPYKIFNVITAH